MHCSFNAKRFDNNGRAYTVACNSAFLASKVYAYLRCMYRMLLSSYIVAFYSSLSSIFACYLYMYVHRAALLALSGI